jgi:hypothetical protein
MINEVLLIGDKPDIERDAVAKSWQQKGGEIKRIGKFWERPNINYNKKITIYGIDTFSLVLAQVTGVKLVEPKDKLISKLDMSWIKRSIDILSISDIDESLFPTFIKPVKPKTFTSKIYKNLDPFLQEVKGIDKSEEVIKSEIITIESETRAFILNNEILDIATYEGDADLTEAKVFLNNFLRHHTINLPVTYVIDLGYNKTNGWFLIEFNASWGAGLNGCNPDKIINAIRAATIN